MGSKIYVGGLPYSATEQQLSDLFAVHGAVDSARIITDKFTGQSRGFGFVEMTSSDEAQKAISALNGTDMGGRTLTVNEARPQEPAKRWRRRLWRSWSQARSLVVITLNQHTGQSSLDGCPVFSLRNCGAVARDNR